MSNLLHLQTGSLQPRGAQEFTPGTQLASPHSVSTALGILATSPVEPSKAGMGGGLVGKGQDINGGAGEQAGELGACRSGLRDRHLSADGHSIVKWKRASPVSLWPKRQNQGPGAEGPRPRLLGGFGG